MDNWVCLENQRLHRASAIASVRMMVMTRKIEFVTIGAHGWNEAAFFQALVAAGVDTFCDVRQRRGMRGHDYAFANSQRLQAKLGDLGIGYVHRRDLAP